MTVAGNSTSIELPAYPAVKSIGSLPPDCRPAIELYGIGTLKNDKGYECQVQITESGLVNIINLQSTATKYWGFTISYPAG